MSDTPGEPRVTPHPSRAARRAAAALAALATFACGPKAEKATPVAKVDHGVTEVQLTTVTLTSESFKRLGIETVVVESTTVAPARTVGGEIVVPPGQSLTVAAPMAGTVVPPEAGSIPTAGARVTSRQPILRLIALPPDRSLLRSQQDLAVADARLRQAQAEGDRVAKLFADRLVSARDHERAQADLAAARADHEAALAQLNLIRSGAPTDSRGLTPLVILAPDAGIIRSLFVGNGQAVAAGAPLAEIVRLDRLWVRVPIYAGDAGRILRTSEATVHGLSGPTAGPIFRATSVAAPPSADASAASVDLFYEIRGSGGALRPGERVGITIPLATMAERALVVPLTAVVHDMNGGAWVYERTDSLVFTRRRVDITRVVGGNAVLSRGVQPGVRVVTAGAAELFGTEFGAGK